MPKVLSLVLALAFLIATNVSAVEPQGFVLKGAFVQSDGSIATSYFPGDGKVYIFKSEGFCNTLKARIDKVLQEKSPELQYRMLCIPAPKEILDGVEKRPEA